MRTSDAAQIAITPHQNCTHPKYTPFNYELAVLGQLLYKGFLVVVCLYCDPDMKCRVAMSNTTALTRSFHIYRDACEAVVSSRCTWIVIGGLSLYMVLVSYSSAIKWMLRLRRGGVSGVGVSTLHRDRCKDSQVTTWKNLVLQPLALGKRNTI